MSKCKHPPAFENSAQRGQTIFEVANLQKKNISKISVLDLSNILSTGSNNQFGKYKFSQNV
jgi:hypothetical protein